MRDNQNTAIMNVDRIASAEKPEKSRKFSPLMVIMASLLTRSLQLLVKPRRGHNMILQEAQPIPYNTNTFRRSSEDSDTIRAKPITTAVWSLSG